MSILASVRSPFRLAVNAAESIRSLAGHGRDRFPLGATPDAGTYRNWRLVLHANHEMGTTAPQYQLWKAVRDGWQPSIWRAEDIETRPEDRTFAGRMANIGGAVGQVS